MNHTFAYPPSNQRLILIFLGWGMDAAPFSSLEKPGYDVMLLSDYTGFCTDDIEALEPALSHYSEIVVMAWSFGVRIAAEFLSQKRGKLPITRTIAVNGTTRHICNECGIPEHIFNGTLANLSPQSVRKFNRRMFSSATEFQAFCEAGGGNRPFESLLKELTTFQQLEPSETDPAMWNTAIISCNDAIIPAANQQRAWSGVSTKLIADAPHFPDLQSIINNEIIDKQLVARRFAAAAPSYGNNAQVQESVAGRLWQLALPHVAATLQTSRNRKLHLLEVGTGCGTLTRHFAPLMTGHHIELCDIAPSQPENLPPGAHFHCCDAETDMRSRSSSTLDTVVSASTIQWFNSPQAFLRETLRVLRPGGIAAISLFGPGTFREISAVTGTSLNYPTLSSLTASIKDHAEILHAEETLTTQYFDDIRQLMRHIKLTGVNALTPQSPSAALRLTRGYKLAPDGRAPLTYHPIYLIFKKPE